MGKLVSKPGDTFAKWVFLPPLKLPSGDIVVLEIQRGDEMEISSALFGMDMKELKRVMAKQAANPHDFRMHVLMRYAVDDPENPDVLKHFEMDRFTVLVLQERELP